MDFNHRSLPSSSWIGEEIWVEIFNKLPMKTLGQSQCVCKSWKSIISSPFFINLHRSSTSSTTPANTKPYLRVFHHKGFNQNRYDLYNPDDQDTLVSEHPLSTFPFGFMKLSTYTKFTFVDVIHGVLCLSYSFHSSSDSVILWNPAIHKYLALPQPPFPWRSDQLSHVNAIGFGYNNSKTDFKVVRVWIPLGYLRNLTYEVYSTREGAWRAETTTTDFRMDSCVLNTREGVSNCFANGTIYWLLPMLNKDDGDSSIYYVLMFDCERGLFRTMELPREIYPKKDRRVERMGADLLEYGGMLSIFARYRILNELHFEIWVLEKHGVATSWKKLYCFSNNGYQTSSEKLAPYGPRQWIKSVHASDVLSYHVYEESMYLMDDAKAKSCSKRRKVFLRVPDGPCPSIFKKCRV